ncbi:hypothetical protein [Haloferula sp. BvORR071]|uniref:hypothetical protein n=1 Tax=Haloferula sp. BvORR071 TaxID=1396141 RepID=UPI000555FCAA|nr:hypothetical protein [Haloferula sp. BvORR071]
MNDGTHSWKRFATAVRQLDADTANTGDQAAPPIPWLPHLSEQVHAFLIRLIWKRWALVGILISLAVLGGFFLASHPAAPAAPLPAIPVPSVP